MYKHCTTEKTAVQQRQFESFLLAAMQTQPYSSISVSELCEEAGLTRKTFYRLFGNKDDVLYALIDHTLTDYVRFSMPAEMLTEDIPEEPQRFFSYWRKQKPLLDALSENRLTAILLERGIAHIVQDQVDTQQWFGADMSGNGKEVILFFISGIMGLVINWHHTGYEKTVAEMAALMYELLTKPPIHIPKQS